jgi:hypothetical protein
VFGGLRALVRDRRKLIWFERHPPQLYDLEADPAEERDLASAHGTETTALLAELDAIVTAAAATSPVCGPPAGSLAPASAATGTAPPSPGPEVRERLRALGYVHDAPAPRAP